MAKKRGHRGGAVEARTIRSTGSVTAAGTSFSPSMCRISARPAASPRRDLLLAQRGQRRVQVLGELDVVEADHGEVARDLEAGLVGGADRAQRGHVGGDHDRGRRLVEREQLAHRVVAAVDVEVAIADVLVARGDAEALQLVAVAAQALGARALVEHAADVRDAAVPELVQMAHGRGGAGLVVGHDGGRERALELEVDADRGDVRAHQPARLGVLLVGAHEHRAVDVVVAAALEVGVRAVAVAGPLRGEDQEVVAGAAGVLLEPAEHLVEERVVDVGVPLPRLEEDADDVRALGDERARRGGGRVVELLGDPHDPLAGLLAHVGVAVERTRYGADGDAGEAGKLVDVRAGLRHQKRFWSMRVAPYSDRHSFVKSPDELQRRLGRGRVRTAAAATSVSSMSHTGIETTFVARVSSRPPIRWSR